MTDRPGRRHGLEPRLAAWPAGKDIAVTVRDDLGHLNLRGDPGDAAFMKAAENVLGRPLPTTPNTISEGEFSIFWLGPDEWLLLPDAAVAHELAESLDDALRGQRFALNDLSGGQLALTVSGERVRDVFARGCTLDFHPGVFTRGLCAQSALARASVLIGATGDHEDFLIVVRRSFADYLLTWLAHAA